MARSVAISAGIHRAKLERSLVAEINTLFKMFEIKCVADYIPRIERRNSVLEPGYCQLRVRHLPTYVSEYFNNYDDMRKYVDKLISDKVNS
jgi:hypothetical protein